MRAGVAVAAILSVGAAFAGAACGKKDKDSGKGKDAGAASAPVAAPKPIPACERYAVALAESDDLVAQPELHDLLRDEAALVRAANRAPTDAERADLTLRCAAGLVDLGKLATDGYGADAGAAASADVDAGIGSGSGGPQCQALLREIERIEVCADAPTSLQSYYRDRRDRAAALGYDESFCGSLVDSAQRALVQYSCP